MECGVTVCRRAPPPVADDRCGPVAHGHLHSSTYSGVDEEVFLKRRGNAARGPLEDRGWELGRDAMRMGKVCV